MSQTAAQLLARCLEANGFRRAFGVPGESYLDLLDALCDSPIEYVTCRQEGGAAMAACAHGQLTGRPGLCMVTRGPGATNASAGLHIAYQGGVPMLMLVGQVPRQERHRESFQELDYTRSLDGLSKWTVEISDPDRIPEFCARAVRTACTGRPGPVVLVLPEDMLAETTEAQPLAAADPAPAPLPPACAEGIRALLDKSERPFLVLGGIGWTAEASAATAAFAEANQIPVGFAFRAHDCLDNHHECAVGPVGIGGCAELGERMKEADLVILNGARAGDDTSYIDAALRHPGPNRKFVHLHPDDGEPGRVFQPDLSAAVAPVQAALGLAPLRAGVTETRRAWRQSCRSAYERFSTVCNDPDWYLSQIITAMEQALPADAVVCNGAGNFAAWLHRFYRFRQTGTALGPISGSMGYDLPAALAAALERPGTPVIAWAGDGSFLMTCQELATAAQTGAKLTVVVVDNGLYGTIRMHQERRFPGRVSGTEILNPDFAALAASFGAHAERADTVEGFQAALDRCLAVDGPSLIHLPVDPRVLAPGMVAAD